MANDECYGTCTVTTLLAVPHEERCVATIVPSSASFKVLKPSKN
jgi:hypothetical protein